MLSRHAFNSMLKTLEEPPEHVKFILATTDPQRLPVTVLSRCLQFNLKALPPLALAGPPEARARGGGHPLRGRRRSAMLARAAAGSVRDSLSLTDQAIAFGSGKVMAAQVADMLGAVGGDLVWPLLEAHRGGATGRARWPRPSGSPSAACRATRPCRTSRAILHRVAMAQHRRAARARRPDAPRIAALAASARRRARPGHVPGGDPRAARPAARTGRDRRFRHGGDAHAFVRHGPPASCCRRARRRRFRRRGRGGSAPPLARRPHRPAAGAGRSRAAAVAREAAPAAESAPPAAAAIAFDGDWTAFVERANLSGMAGLLARYGELDRSRATTSSSSLPEAHRMYAEKSYQDKLKAELAPRFGAGFRLSVRVGPDEREERGGSARRSRRRSGSTARRPRSRPTRSCATWWKAWARRSCRRPSGPRATGNPSQPRTGEANHDEGRTGRTDEAGAADAGEHAQGPGEPRVRSRSRASRARGS